MILVDSNIPMYLVGDDPDQKESAQRVLDDAVSREEFLVTDAEVLQEILHRYSAIQRIEAIQPAFDAVLGIADEVLPVDLAAVEEAKQILLGAYGVSARDAIHLAVMRSAEITRILSFDSAFDRFPGVERLA